MDTAEKIIARMAALDIKGIDITKKIGASSGAISQWRKGISAPSGKYLVLLAKMLKCDPEWLLSENGKAPPEFEDNTLPAPSHGRIPLISWVQAGTWAESPDIYAPGDAEEWLLQAVPNAPNCFALRVSGPSMDDGTANGYRDGDIIHVNPDAEWKHNDDVIVKNGDDEVTFKRLVCQGDKCHLVPLNPSWPEKIIPLDGHCIIIGVVVFSGRYRV